MTAPVPALTFAAAVAVWLAWLILPWRTVVRLVRYWPLRGPLGRLPEAPSYAIATYGRVGDGPKS